MHSLTPSRKKQPCKSIKILAASVALALPITLASCTAMRSQEVPLETTTANDGKLKTVKGASYCLPIGKIKIRVTRYGNGPAQVAQNELALDRVTQDLETAKANQPKLEQEQKTADAVAKVAEDKWKAATDPAEKEKLNVELKIKQREAETAAAKFKAGSDNIKTLTANIKTAALAATADRPLYRISHVSTDYYPDRSKQFAVRYSPNAMANDEISVDVGADSLLREVDVKVKDMSVEASKKLFQIGKNLLEAYYRGTAALPFGGDAEKTVFEGSFDPVNTSELQEVNTTLANIEGGPYCVKVVGKSSPSYKESSSTYVAEKRRNVPGVAYRSVLAYDIVLTGPKEIKERDRSEQSVHQIATVMLPNEAEVLYFPLARSAFVQRNTNLKFEHGMLTKVTLSKPSEINEGLEIPLELSRTLAALPGQLVGASVEGMKSRRTLHDEHIGFLEKELDYEAKLRKLRGEQKGTETGEQIKPPGTPVPSGSNQSKTSDPKSAASQPQTKPGDSAGNSPSLPPENLEAFPLPEKP